MPQMWVCRKNWMKNKPKSEKEIIKPYLHAANR